MFEPASYTALHLYGADIVAMICRAFPSVSLVPADAMLARLRAMKTSHEVNAIRKACRIAERAFCQAVGQLRAGITELEAAELFRGAFSSAIAHFAGVERADAYIYCMSGPNSALASAAYARSRTRRIAAGDLVLIHCNSYTDGYWTDITRTYSCGEPDSRAKAIRDAVFAAREAALGAIAPGAAAANVDHAAREVLRERGFGPQFKHSTGHGIGFAAIDGNAQPRLHPASPDIIQTDMVFNVEPAIYINNFGGIRHCDMVAITKTSTELLTDFQCRPEELVLREG
jgi:Xaa-Pro aminopeptidase